MRNILIDMIDSVECKENQLPLDVTDYKVRRRRSCVNSHVLMNVIVRVKTHSDQIDSSTKRKDWPCNELASEKERQVNIARSAVQRRVIKTNDISFLFSPIAYITIVIARYLLIRNSIVSSLLSSSIGFFLLLL